MSILNGHCLQHFNVFLKVSQTFLLTNSYLYYMCSLTGILKYACFYSWFHVMLYIICICLQFCLFTYCIIFIVNFEKICCYLITTTEFVWKLYFKIMFLCLSSKWKNIVMHTGKIFFPGEFIKIKKKEIECAYCKS